MTPHLSIRRFWQDTRAAVAFEAAILTPLLAWFFVASFVFFDAYRVYNSSIKATYTVADILSRQTNTVYPSDIQGMSNIFERIVRDSANTRMRVTQIRWQNDGYFVDWSHATGGEVRLFDANMPDIEESLPRMVNGERIILVETFVPYQPAFELGLNGIAFTNFTFTRPRYAGQVPFDPDGPPAGA